MKRVSVLGGYGVFGGRVAVALAAHPSTEVRIVGRNRAAGEAFSRKHSIKFVLADVEDDEALRKAIDGSELVIHAAGPFQGCDYRVAERSLEVGAHYLDMADARQFVAGIGTLNARAKERARFVSAGVSSVPAITSALASSMADAFTSIEEIQIALSPGNQNPRGASTIGAILSYLGRPIRTWEDGAWAERQGWGDAKWLDFPPPVGRRRVQRCDVPDLELFGDLFGARTVRFHAGLELNVFNYCLSGFGILRRRGYLNALPKHAELFRKVSLLLSSFGSKMGSLAVWLRGTGVDGASLERSAAIVTDDDGPATPAAAAIVLARRILDQGPPCVGAFPCIGFVGLDELIQHLEGYGIWLARNDGSGWRQAPG